MNDLHEVAVQTIWANCHLLVKGRSDHPASLRYLVALTGVRTLHRITPNHTAHISHIKETPERLEDCRPAIFRGCPFPSCNWLRCPQNDGGIDPLLGEDILRCTGCHIVSQSLVHSPLLIISVSLLGSLLQHAVPANVSHVHLSVLSIH